MVPTPIKETLVPRSADALLFDLGRVVIDFDVGRSLAHWAHQAGCAVDDVAMRFVRDDAFWRYEAGEISDDQYFSLLRESLGLNLSETQLREGWNATFIGEMPGIAPLLEQAKKHLPLYALSNTNPAHIAHFSLHYRDVLANFREIFASSTIKLRKPHAEAYTHVVNRIGVPAERIVFFDDLAENIEGARACGLQAVHVTSTDDIANALSALGVLETI